jgi:phosphoglycerate dehydrogenase-like enzyme
MNILLTTQKGDIRDIYFPKTAIEALEKMGKVTCNDSDERLSEQELIENIRDIDICITHWGCPRFSSTVLEHADKLKLIVHAAGSVANIASDEVYNKGIMVCSANDVMARFVAEGVLVCMLSGLRWIPQQDADMKNGKLWERKVLESKSLFGERIGLIGFGTVGMYLLELLKPFGVKIKLFDPYLPVNALRSFPEVAFGTLEEVLDWGNIISLHASLTPETRHMISAEQLRRVKDQALFINTARGAIIEQKALEEELIKGRFQAVLDVYEEEPLPLNSCLRKLQNVILLPHMAGAPARDEMTFAMIEEMERFIQGEPLKYEITYEKYKRMTRE